MQSLVVSSIYRISTLRLWVANAKFTLLLLALPTKSVGYTTLMSAPHLVKPMLVTST